MKINPEATFIKIVLNELNMSSTIRPATVTNIDGNVPAYTYDKFYCKYKINPEITINKYKKYLSNTASFKTQDFTFKLYKNTNTYISPYFYTTQSQGSGQPVKYKILHSAKLIGVYPNPLYNTFVSAVKSSIDSDTDIPKIIEDFGSLPKALLEIIKILPNTANNGYCTPLVSCPEAHDNIALIYQTMLNSAIFVEYNGDIYSNIDGNTFATNNTMDELDYGYLSSQPVTQSVDATTTVDSVPYMEMRWDTRQLNKLTL